MDNLQPAVQIWPVGCSNLVPCLLEKCMHSSPWRNYVVNITTYNAQYHVMLDPGDSVCSNSAQTWIICVKGLKMNEQKITSKAKMSMDVLLMQSLVHDLSDSASCCLSNGLVFNYCP